MKRGIKYATDGISRITRLVPQVKIRIVGFLVVVTLGSILLVGITKSLWAQLEQLQTDHAAIKSETFYLGVHLRGTLRGLNENLLQYAVSQDPTFREAFLNDAAGLKDWMTTNTIALAQAAKLPLLSTADLSAQVQLFQQIATNFDVYVSAADHILEQTNTPAPPGAFEDAYKTVRKISSGLFPLYNDLVQAERESFTKFLGHTQNTLLRHQRLLMLAWSLALALALVLAVLGYRGMIAPLRMGLRESSSIIERQEKLAALGVLASGVAHEIRNPLTAIKFRLFSLKKANPAIAENEDLVLISGEIDRVEQIVRHFFTFARPPEPRLLRIHVEDVLRSVVELFGPQLESSGIAVKIQIDPSLDVYADAEQIKQTLINLVKNAAESINRNGTIQLGVRREVVELDGRARGAAVISVTDTGQGIPAEVEARIFDPFFTTKDQGTGLGLAISARIIGKHGGLLRYKTEMNVGTTFELVLPVIE